MSSFPAKVAVVTGAASGIGLALAEGAVARGFKVVIADIREKALGEAFETLIAMGGDVLAVTTDVSKFADVEALGATAIKRFGKVNLVVNNAGVFTPIVSWEASLEEYEWIIGVNLNSVIYGIKVFLPRMITQGDVCHMVNVASGAALVVSPGFGAYSLTKHAVLALSEALYLDLAARGVAGIGVTIVMPGGVQSNIMSPGKAGPRSLRDVLYSGCSDPILSAVEQQVQNGVESGMRPSILSDMVFTAIARNDLYVLPNFTDPASQAMAASIAQGRCMGRNPYVAMPAGNAG